MRIPIALAACLTLAIPAAQDSVHFPANDRVTVRLMSDVRAVVN